MSDAAANATPASTVDLQTTRKLSLLLGLGGFVAFLVLGIALASAGLTDLKHVFMSYLTGFIFWFSIGMGSWFFLCVQYVTGGRWGVLTRRPLEANVRTLALAVVFFIPIGVTYFMGSKSMYWWASHEHHTHVHEGEAQPEKPKEKQPWVRPGMVTPNLEHDEEKKQSDYLNPTFSIIRVFIYLAAFGLMIFWMLKNAMTAEYNADEKVAAKARDNQKYVGSIGLFVFAIFCTFIATDWVMSLEKTFNSTMYPVIFFGNAALTAWLVGILTMLWLKRMNHPQYVNYFTPGEQVHLGSLLLAFTLFWAYTNFAQFMLTWIGNLSEEIPYYISRTNYGWGYVAGFMMIFHFFVPFLLLVFRAVKSNPKVLKIISCCLLFVCFVHVSWWISPSGQYGSDAKHSLPVDLLLNAAALVGVGGVWMWYSLGQLAKHPLLPSREVYILEAYHHGH